jgi:RNA polymerase sigma-70 factor (ECF subfamily)
MKKKSLENLFAQEVTEQKEKYYRLAYSYTKNSEDALDVVQDSIYKALSSLDTLKDSSALRTWFCRIIVTTSLDFLRRNRIFRLANEELTEDQIIEKNLYPDVDLQKAMAELPLMYQSIVILRYFEDLKIDEVASVLNINSNTVKTRLYAALRILRLEMEE